MLHLLVEEGKVYHLAYVFHIMERQPLQILGFDLLDIFPVLLTQYQLLDAGTFGCEYLLLDTAYGEHLAAQRYLARHGKVLLHLTLREGRDERCCHGDTCARSVFGDGSFGHVDMHVPILEHILADIENRSMGMDILESKHGRLFHHVAEVTRQCQLRAFAAAEARLDEEYLAAHGSPRQPRHHAGVFVPLILVAAILHRPEIFVQVFRLDLRGCRLARSNPTCQLAHYLGNLLVKLANAALTGVRLNDRLQCLLRELHLALPDAMRLHQLGHKMAGGYLHLLFLYVSAHLDKLHTVEQGLRDGVEVVCRGNEHDLAEVVVDIEIIVVEGRVLLRIKDLQQCGGWVALEVGCNLVYLVEDEHRVRAACLPDVLYDTSAHGTDVGAAMTAYLSLVVQSAKRDAHILTVQSLGNGLAERRLAHSRRTV